MRTEQHGFSDVHWTGILGWRTYCACGKSFGDEGWHAHAHAVGIDPHGRHFGNVECPCSVTCQEVRP